MYHVIKKTQKSNRIRGHEGPFPTSYLIDAVISVAFLWAVFAVFATLAAANHPDRFASLPVLGISPVLIVHRCVAVQCQRPGNEAKQSYFI